MTPEKRHTIRVPITVELDIEFVSREAENPLGKAAKEPGARIPDDLGYVLKPEEDRPQMQLFASNGDQ